MEEIRRVAKSIRFKEYLLSRDVSSRRVILNTAIRYMEKSDDAKKVQAIAWLNNVLLINDLIDSNERRTQIRYDVFWDELHYELSASRSFDDIMSWFAIA
jgi:hypothetical protein